MRIESTREIANCFYAGLMTDTGGFRHNNTTQKEFLMASEWLAWGPSSEVAASYDNSTLERLRLQALFWLKSFQCFLYRTPYDHQFGRLKKFGSKRVTRRLVNYPFPSAASGWLSWCMDERRDQNYPSDPLANFLLMICTKTFWRWWHRMLLAISD